jgi:putative membrane protein
VAAVDLAEEAPVTVGKKWLKRYLNEPEIVQISEAVKAAEIKTSGEIIPMVVRQCTPTCHISTIYALLIFCSLLILDLETSLSNWDMNYMWTLPGLAIASFMIGTVISKFDWTQRMFLSNRDMQLEVLERAELEFYRGRYHETAAHTGILIFVSILERRVVVLADRGISSKLPQSTWDDVAALLTENLKKRDFLKGMTAAIQKCGEILAREFPAKGLNPNEISNELVIKE